MPDPATEPEFDWLWWYPTILASFGAATAAIANPVPQGESFDRIRVESKAMRKMKPGESLVLVAQYENIAGNPAVDVNGSLRFLFGM